MHNWLTGASHIVMMKTLTTLALVIIVAGARTTGALQQSVTGNPSGAFSGTADRENDLEQTNGSNLGSVPKGTSSGSQGDDSPAPTSSVEQPGVVTDSNSPSHVTSGGMTTSSSPSPTSSPTPAPEPAPSPQPVASRFRDGTYNDVGTYTIPTGNTESLGVTLVLSSDVIVDSSVTNMAKDPRSVSYQNDFIAAYKSFVIGKKIDEVSLTKVSGSSLTTIGFNNATDKIEASAKN